MVGVPAPAHRDAPRACGKYRVLAPEMAPGTVLAVRIEVGSARVSNGLVQVRENDSGERFFCDVDGIPVQGIVSWSEAPSAKATAFLLEQQIANWADAVQLRGAPAFAAALGQLSPLARDNALVFTADALVERGKRGLASAVLAYRWTDS